MRSPRTAAVNSLTLVLVALAAMSVGSIFGVADAAARLVHPHVEVKVDGAGRVVAAIGGGSSQRVGVLRLTSGGGLDPSFAGDGMIGPRPSQQSAELALGPKDSVFVAEAPEGRDPILRKYLANGRPDRSFGRRGVRPIPIIPKGRLFVQPDGHVLVLVQETCPSSSCGYKLSYLEVLHYDKRGRLVAKNTEYNEEWEFRAAAMAADGSFIVIGRDEDLGYTTLGRFRPDGHVDPSLGGKEGLTINDPQYGEPDEPGELVAPTSVMTIQPDGGFILGDDVVASGVTRRNPDGSLDKAFGKEGAAVCASGDIREGPTRQYSALAAEPDGSVLAAGGIGNCGLVRLLPDGQPDPSFGIGGHVNLEALGLPRPLALALTPDGGAVVAGWDAATRAVELARLTADGNLDPGFGVDGVTAIRGF